MSSGWDLIRPAFIDFRQISVLWTGRVIASFYVTVARGNALNQWLSKRVAESAVKTKQQGSFETPRRIRGCRASPRLCRPPSLGSSISTISPPIFAFMARTLPPEHPVADAHERLLAAAMQRNLDRSVQTSVSHRIANYILNGAAH